MFNKHYTCPCGTQWWNEWENQCNDRCPTCDAEIEPDDYEERDAPPTGEQFLRSARAYIPECGNGLAGS